MNEKDLVSQLESLVQKKGTLKSEKLARQALEIIDQADEPNSKAYKNYKKRLKNIAEDCPSRMFRILSCIESYVEEFKKIGDKGGSYFDGLALEESADTDKE